LNALANGSFFCKSAIPLEDLKKRKGLFAASCFAHKAIQDRANKNYPIPKRSQIEEEPLSVGGRQIWDDILSRLICENFAEKSSIFLLSLQQLNENKELIPCKNFLLCNGKRLTLVHAGPFLKNFLICFKRCRCLHAKVHR
jgi:hypothetical protein